MILFTKINNDTKVKATFEKEVNLDHYLATAEIHGIGDTEEEALSALRTAAGQLIGELNEMLNTFVPNNVIKNNSMTC